MAFFDALRQKYALYLELTKPRLTALVLVTTAIGYWMGLHPEQSFLPIFPLILFTALVAGGVNALNMWYEHEHDAQMQRTAARPIPSGRISARETFYYGMTIVILGSLGMGLAINWTAALIGFLSAVTYVWVYTPLKRVTALCTLVGAVPGALPILIGWAAARGSIGIEGWTLFAILFVWQLPHFLALAMMFKEDYARAGYRMLPLYPDGAAMTVRQMVLYTAVLVPLSLLPTLLGMTGIWYFGFALLLGLAFVNFSFKAAMVRTLPACRKVFLASITYLPFLLLFMAADKRL